MSPRSGASAASAAGVTDEIVCCILLLGRIGRRTPSRLLGTSQHVGIERQSQTAAWIHSRTEGDVVRLACEADAWSPVDTTYRILQRLGSRTRSISTFKDSKFTVKGRSRLLVTQRRGTESAGWIERQSSILPLVESRNQELDQAGTPQAA